MHAFLVNIERDTDRDPVIEALMQNLLEDHGREKINYDDNDSDYDDDIGDIRQQFQDANWQESWEELGWTEETLQARKLLKQSNLSLKLLSFSESKDICCRSQA